MMIFCASVVKVKRTDARRGEFTLAAKLRRIAASLFRGANSGPEAWRPNVRTAQIRLRWLLLIDLIGGGSKRYEFS